MKADDSLAAAGRRHTQVSVDDVSWVSDSYSIRKMVVYRMSNIKTVLFFSQCYTFYRSVVTNMRKKQVLGPLADWFSVKIHRSPKHLIC